MALPLPPGRQFLGSWVVYIAAAAAADNNNDQKPLSVLMYPGAAILMTWQTAIGRGVCSAPAQIPAPL